MTFNIHTILVCILFGTAIPTSAFFGLFYIFTCNIILLTYSYSQKLLIFILSIIFSCSRVWRVIEIYDDPDAAQLYNDVCKTLVYEMLKYLFCLEDSKPALWDKVNEEHDSYLKYDCCRKLTTGNSNSNQLGGWTGNIRFMLEIPRELRRRSLNPISVLECGISVSHLALSFWAFILRVNTILATRVNRTALLADFLQGFIQDFCPGWGHNTIVITI